MLELQYSFPLFSVYTSPTNKQKIKEAKSCRSIHGLSVGSRHCSNEKLHGRQQRVWILFTGQGRIFILFEQHDIAFPRPKRRWVVYIIGKNRKFVNCAYHVLFLIDLLVKALAIYFHFGHVIYFYQLWQFSEVLI
jgi:hypothetical protein